MKKLFVVLACLGFFISFVHGETKHGSSSIYPSYEGRVMCGYQGWFRAEGDGAGQGWVHYGTRGKFGPSNLHIDLWPDVSEYKKTYPTSFLKPDGSPATVFSSWDESTVDLHFHWMRDYGIDGAFVQRFFGGLRTEQGRRKSRVVLEHALEASKKYGRAIAVMYDLSGLSSKGEDCSAVIQDWKELVDQLKITSRGADQTYLYHNKKPVVAIWGIGFPDRPYNIHDIGIEKLISFLKNDPEYGGCSVMLGVPCYFRKFGPDSLHDPYLHEVISSADIILPWMVGRYPRLDQSEISRYEAQVKDDIAWCADRHLAYVPCVYPGFSWYNLSKTEFGGIHSLNQIPRQKGTFYWEQISAAVKSGSKMLYVAMFDEMDEGTAIFKCSNQTPDKSRFIDYEGLPSDHYLWLTGKAREMLRGEIPFSKDVPIRNEQKPAKAASLEKK
jgi:Glycosyl hydrolase family 99